MDYTKKLRFEQQALPFGEDSSQQEYLLVPSFLKGFHNTDTLQELSPAGIPRFRLYGTLDSRDADRVCPECGGHMHVNNRSMKSLAHLPFGGTHSCLSFRHIQYLCPECGHTQMQEIL